MYAVDVTASVHVYDGIHNVQGVSLIPLPSPIAIIPEQQGSGSGIFDF